MMNGSNGSWQVFAVAREHLKEMPLDYDGKHATGDCVKLSTTGEWVTEYEGEEYEDAPNCVETWEEDQNGIFSSPHFFGAITLRRNENEKTRN